MVANSRTRVPFPSQDDRRVIPPIVFWFAVLASVLYTFGVLLLKRATRWHPGAWRTTFICNWVTAALFLPVFGFGGQIPSPSLLWQPAVVGTLFVAGQILSIVALTRGDVSVATPMLGVKILLVAAFSSLVSDEGLNGRVWISAGLATLAVALLGTSGGPGQHRRVGFTLLCSTAAAASYAMFDVLVQHWAPAWGVGRFMPLTMIAGAVVSLALLIGFDDGLRGLARPALFWVGWGSLLVGLQAVVFTSTIATWGHAAGANVVYSARGLWTVALIWAFGEWFSHAESSRGPRVMFIRLLGAASLSLAIFLIL